MQFSEVIAANPWLLFLSIFILGLVVGSFLNVVILRYPEILKYSWEKECAEYLEKPFKKTKPPGLILSRSYCPKCKKQLRAWHNIPLFSFLFLKGACGFCKEPIPWRYPVVELLTGLLSLLLAYSYGFSYQLIAALILLWFLIAITGIDVDTYLIPDQLSLTLLWVGLFISLFGVFITVEEAVVGALVGYLSLWLVFWIFKLATGKEGMGYGDFKLLAAGGAWLGAEPLLIVLIMASITGLLAAVVEKFFGNGSGKIPFGPYLSAGIFITLLFGGELLEWYLP
ncbi:prepilin peptidase [Marinicella rhabdoformis]|uniref:prepilin peptidase n=1 Tax=Marinicella rhabdoformis TaxID=2580566 RepID=UPI0012AED512|nr:A24 family peptidase [Marinicella rhabdoformis]